MKQNQQPENTWDQKIQGNGEKRNKDVREQEKQKERESVNKRKRKRERASRT